MAKILIVEDEPLIAMLVEDWLIEAGHEAVGPAMTLDTAKALLATHRVDAALIDLMIGTSNGESLAESLIQRRIPFLFATAFDVRGVSRRYPNTPIIVKPFERDEFDLAVERLLSEPCCDTAA